MYNTIHFSGVGLGIGRSTTPFTADILVEGNNLEGSGKDENGNFKLVLFPIC